MRLSATNRDRLPPVSPAAHARFSNQERRSAIRSASVLIPTYQGAEFLERVLSALASQTWEKPWDLLAIDSGSDDGTLAILERFQRDFPVPLRFESIHGCEFDHGDTRNLLAARSSGDLLVYLTQDAIPIGSRWLADLAANFDDRQVGGAYCRNTARPESSPATKILCAGDPGYALERVVTRRPADYEQLDPHQRRLLFNFNDVASAIAREFWERHPFPRTWFGEDVLMARALIEAGFDVVYDADAAVEHSHDYDAEETYQRARIDGRFGAEWLDRVAFQKSSDVEAHAKRMKAVDAQAIAAAGLQGDPARALAKELGDLRLAAFRGLYEGGRSELRRNKSRMLARSDLHILFVVHGFPPNTWAGTEVYTLELGKALVARGHRCTVLTRTDPGRSVAQGGPPEFSIERDHFDGLDVLRMVHRLEHKNLRESYSKRGPEAAFQRVLDQMRPDVVHFQHLIHNSVGLVEIAKERGLATVVHCHDYWSICARVQLIRPDGVRCTENMGAGCLLCVKEQALEHVPRMKLIGQLGGPNFARNVSKRLAKAPAGSAFRKRFEGLSDLLERGPAVLAAYASADLRISPSRFLRDKLLETGAFDAHTFLYSDNGLRTDHVQALAKRPDEAGRIRFGFVGSLVWYKGVEVLLEAMARLRDPRAALHVYGAFDPQHDEHHARLAELTELAERAGSQVEFHGRFDNSQLSEVYAQIDVLVVPSLWWENSPITIHEAFLTKTPVVASNIGGMAEYVRDGVDGLHFRVGDADDLARVLGRFLSEPGLLTALSNDWMRVKSANENAAEMEFRYRALVCQERLRDVLCLLDGAADLRYESEGAVERQGTDLLLLRPGSRVRIELANPTADAIDAELTLTLLTLGGETGVVLGGQVLLDGVLLGNIESIPSGGQDRVHECRFSFRTERASSVLELCSGDLYLRIAKIRVCEAQELLVG